jgi:hypothetical protein
VFINDETIHLNNPQLCIHYPYINSTRPQALPQIRQGRTVAPMPRFIQSSAVKCLKRLKSWISVSETIAGSFQT